VKLSELLNRVKAIQVVGNANRRNEDDLSIREL
jgi:hypothetical protein